MHPIMIGIVVVNTSITVIYWIFILTECFCVSGFVWWNCSVLYSFNTFLHADWVLGPHPNEEEWESDLPGIEEDRWKTAVQAKRWMTINVEEERKGFPPLVKSPSV
ncbi:hypothetical protein UPYG_G00034140 [Umbra pygmaea]|uniref:Uncharacterized protein n=1 Tax=Umbra pygmaea TaxID=75934 RepID=A0ABD0XNF0_UMBPY